MPDGIKLDFGLNKLTNKNKKKGSRVSIFSSKKDRRSPSSEEKPNKTRTHSSAHEQPRTERNDESYVNRSNNRTSSTTMAADERVKRLPVPLAISRHERRRAQVEETPETSKNDDGSKNSRQEKRRIRRHSKGEDNDERLRRHSKVEEESDDKEEMIRKKKKGPHSDHIKGRKKNSEVPSSSGPIPLREQPRERKRNRELEEGDTDNTERRNNDTTDMNDDTDERRNKRRGTMDSLRNRTERDINDERRNKRRGDNNERHRSPEEEDDSKRNNGQDERQRHRSPDDSRSLRPGSSRAEDRQRSQRLGSSRPILTRPEPAHRSPTRLHPRDSRITSVQERERRHSTLSRPLPVDEYNRRQKQNGLRSHSYNMRSRRRRRSEEEKIESNPPEPMERNQRRPGRLMRESEREGRIEQGRIEQDLKYKDRTSSSVTPQKIINTRSRRGLDRKELSPPPSRPLKKRRLHKKSPPESDDDDSDEKPLVPQNGPFRTRRGRVVRLPPNHPSHRFENSEEPAALEQWEQDRNEIKSVLQKHYNGDPHAKQILIATLDLCFNRYKSNRHAFMHQTCDMIGLALTEIHEEAKGKKETALKMISEADQTKRSLEEQNNVANQTLEIKNDLLRTVLNEKEVEENAMERIDEDCHNKHKLLESKLKEYTKLNKEFSADFDRMEQFKKLRESPDEVTKVNKKLYDKILPLLKRANVEESLFHALEKSLCAPILERQDFDHHVNETGCKTLTTFIENQEIILENIRIELNQLEEQAKEAKKEFDTAVNKLEESVRKVQDVQAEIVQLQNTKERLTSELEDHPKEVQKNEEAHQNANDLIDFFLTIYTKYLGLRDRDTEVQELPPPPPPPESVAPVNPGPPMNSSINSGPQMNSPMNSAMNTQINSPINTQINVSLNTQMNSSMNAKMNSPLNSPMNGPMNPQMNSPINPQINSPMNPQMNSPMNSPMNPQMSPSMSPQMNPQMNSPMNPQMNSPMNPQMNHPMNPQMNHPMNPQMNSPMNPQMNPSMNPQMNPSMSAQLNAPINPQMNSPMNPQMNSPMNPQMEVMQPVNIPQMQRQSEVQSGVNVSNFPSRGQMVMNEDMAMSQAAAVSEDFIGRGPIVEEEDEEEEDPSFAWAALEAVGRRSLHEAV